MAPSVGDEAPDFELKDQHGQTVRLSSLRGRKAAQPAGAAPEAASSPCIGDVLAG